MPGIQSTLNKCLLSQAESPSIHPSSQLLLSKSALVKEQNGLRNFWITGPPGKSSIITFLTQRSGFSRQILLSVSLCFPSRSQLGAVEAWGWWTWNLYAHTEKQVLLHFLWPETQTVGKVKSIDWPQFEGRGQREEIAWWQSLGPIWTCWPEFEVFSEVVDNGTPPPQTGILEHLKRTHGRWTGNAPVSVLASPRAEMKQSFERRVELLHCKKFSEDLS